MKFSTFEEKLFTKRIWKRIVKGLSCIVVFCTVYALILPAITIEANAYCGQEEHKHTWSCYKNERICTKSEHTHSDECYDDQGNLICSLEEHTHNADCYEQVLDCELTEHTHSLQCFSNPKADLEDEKDWKLPDPEEDQTKRERIVQAAESQIGQKESSDNYLVQDETIKKGISRYGQWDHEDYEDWSGAFVRFILEKSQADSTSKDAPKPVLDWMKELSEQEDLLVVDDVASGDVLFIYDENDQEGPKAGIVTDIDEEAITAIMGDWNNEVKKERFSKTDDRLHSVLKPVEDEFESQDSLNSDTNQTGNSNENQTKGSEWMDENNPDTPNKSDQDQSNQPDQSDQSPTNQDSSTSSDWTEEGTDKNSEDKLNETDKKNNQKGQEDSQLNSQENKTYNNPNYNTNKTNRTEDSYTNSKNYSDKSTNNNQKNDSSSTSIIGKADSNFPVPKPVKKEDTNKQKTNESEDKNKASDQTSQTKDGMDPDKQDSQSSKTTDANKDPEKDTNQTKDGEEDSAEQQDASSEQEESGWKYSKEAKASDGAIVKASWNDGTFEADEITFLAKKTELPEKAQKQIEKKLQGEDQNYAYLTYDLTFYEKVLGEDLKEIEPLKPVKVEITLPDQIEETKYDLFHIDDNGKVEQLVDQGELTASQKEDEERSRIQQTTDLQEKPISSGEKSADSISYTAEFESDSFSLFTVVIQGNSTHSIWNTNDGNTDWYWGSIDNQGNFSGAVNVLEQDIWTNYKLFSSNTSGQAVAIDLNGHSIHANNDTLFEVKNGFTLIIRNTADNGPNVEYSNENSTYSSPKKSQVKVGTIYGTNTGEVIKVYGGRLQIENTAIIDGGAQINAQSGSQIDLNNAYLLKGNRGLCIENSSMEMNGGAISDHSGTNTNTNYSKLPGAGIYANNSSIVLNGGAVIANNTVKTIGNGDTVGGGIYATGASTIKLHNAAVAGNSCWGDSTTSGSWATGGGIKAKDGAKLYLYDGAKVSGNFSDNGGGGISLSDKGTYLYMLEGSTVTGNYAKANEGGGIALQAQDSSTKQDGFSTAVLLGGTISNNKTDTGNNNTSAQWGGGGIFVGHTAKLILPNGADVYNNTAQNLGGGVAGCSTGKIYVDETLTVKNNTANGNGVWSTGEKQYDKEYATSNHLVADKSLAQDYFTCFYASVPGQFTDTSANWKGSVDKHLVNGVVDGRLTSQYCMGLTSVDSEQKFTKPVKVYENTSYTHGGGILVNGYMISGDVQYIYNSDTFNVEGTKQIKSNNRAVTTGYEDFVFDLKLADALVGSARPDSTGTFKITNVVTESTQMGSTTIQYYLTERNTNQAGVEYDQAQYRIDVTINTTQVDTWTYTYENPEDNQTHTVTVIEYNNEISFIDVYKKTGEAWNTYPHNTSHESTELSQREQWTVKLNPADKTFTNILHKKDIEVKKTWSDSGTHKPVTVALKRSVNSDHSDAETVEEVELGNPDWIHLWDDLPAINSSNKTYIYWVEEVTRVDGYIPVITTTSDTNADKDTFSIVNTKIANILRITKVEEGDDTKLLEGAEFTLYQGSDDQGEVFKTGITDENGLLEFTDLPEGTYFLKEIKAPTGYEIPKENGWLVTFDNTEQNNPILTIEQKVENTLLVYVLPETGGPGIRFYTVAGTAMLISSFLLYEYSKKRAKKGGD